MLEKLKAFFPTVDFSDKGLFMSIAPFPVPHPITVINIHKLKLFCLLYYVSSFIILIFACDYTSRERKM